MSVRPIISFPDPKLDQPSAPITEFGAATAALATDLIDTLKDEQALGLTAAHIGVLQRIYVLRLTPAEEPVIYINPRILSESADKVRFTEGSVSMPGATEEIERSAAVTIRFRTVEGEEMTEQAEGFRAVCHLHEIDQLDGIFWLKRLSRLKRERLVKKFKKSAAR